MTSIDYNDCGSVHEQPSFLDWCLWKYLRPRERERERERERDRDRETECVKERVRERIE